MYFFLQFRNLYEQNWILIWRCSSKYFIASLISKRYLYYYYYLLSNFIQKKKTNYQRQNIFDLVGEHSELQMSHHNGKWEFKFESIRWCSINPMNTFILLNKWVIEVSLHGSLNKIIWYVLKMYFVSLYAEHIAHSLRHKW